MSDIDEQQLADDLRAAVDRVNELTRKATEQADLRVEFNCMDVGEVGNPYGRLLSVQITKEL